MYSEACYSLLNFTSLSLFCKLFPSEIYWDFHLQTLNSQNKRELSFTLRQNGCYQICLRLIETYRCNETYNNGNRNIRLVPREERGYSHHSFAVALPLGPNRTRIEKAEKPTHSKRNSDIKRVIIERGK